MRLTSVVLVVLLLFSGPGLAGKKKREKLEACKESIEFVPPAAEPISTWGSKLPTEPYGDEWAECCNAGRIWFEDFRHDTTWQKGAKGAVDGREYVVIRRYDWKTRWPSYDLNSFQYSVERAREYACRWGGTAILHAETYCSGTCDPTPPGFLDDRTWSVGLTGIVIKWVDEEEGEGE